jgi:cytochrome b involved in lipid metabolism
MDWVRKTAASREDLSGLGGKPPRSDITMDEVARHATAEDGWTVLRGRVYCLSSYMKYHPGGAKILGSVLGKDCTALFNKYHAWVNAEFLLNSCLVGRLAAEDAGAASASSSAATRMR